MVGPVVDDDTAVAEESRPAEYLDLARRAFTAGWGLGWGTKDRKDLHDIRARSDCFTERCEFVAGQLLPAAPYGRD